MSRLIIANHKMNFTLEESFNYCVNISKLGSHKNNLILAVAAPYLAYLANNFKSLTFCAQDVSRQKVFGSYTGEYSCEMIKSCGVNYAIIGHSERRNLFFETEDVISQKIENCLRFSITPIICVGEIRKLKQNDHYKEVLLTQLKSILNCISSIISEKNSIAQVIFAYEPIWAIGTGIIPSEEELLKTVDIISSIIKSSAIANNFKLVYGGSVGLDNIENILNVKNIDGVLVGRASLNSEDVLHMLSV